MSVSKIEKNGKEIIPVQTASLEKSLKNKKSKTAT